MFRDNFDKISYVQSNSNFVLGLNVDVACSANNVLTKQQELENNAKLINNKPHGPYMVDTRCTCGANIVQHSQLDMKDNILDITDNQMNLSFIDTDAPTINTVTRNAPGMTLSQEPNLEKVSS